MASYMEKAWWTAKLEEAYAGGGSGTIFFERPGYCGYSVPKEFLPALKARCPVIPFDATTMPDGRSLKNQPWWNGAAKPAILDFFEQGDDFHTHKRKGMSIINWDGKEAAAVHNYVSVPARNQCGSTQPTAAGSASSAYPPPPPPVFHPPPPLPSAPARPMPPPAAAAPPPVVNPPQPRVGPARGGAGRGGGGAGGRGGGGGRGGKGGGRGGGLPASMPPPVGQQNQQPAVAQPLLSFPRARGRTMCRYGAQCRFQNAEHFSRFNHPDEHPLIQPPLQPQQPPVPSVQMAAPMPQAPQQHPQQLHPQQPVLSMSMSMGQTIGDLSDAPSYLVRIGVPKDQADALLVVYPGKPLRAAHAFARENPSGPVFFLCGSHRHTARDSPRLLEDPDDKNNTCFSIFDFFEGKLGDSKTLTRVIDYLRTRPPTLARPLAPSARIKLVPLCAPSVRSCCMPYSQDASARAASQACPAAPTTSSR